ncbi:hypothetical protein [Micromonospora psammae]|uniref:hypothetical protein n=1 Tax=Micromonospora sp. CPCC 205556 TaxID=3122398 RepID=UPI002FF2CFA9
MREPSADRPDATPDDLPLAAVLPELLRGVREGQVVYLSERDEPVAAVLAVQVARRRWRPWSRSDEGAP